MNEWDDPPETLFTQTRRITLREAILGFFGLITLWWKMLLWRDET